MIDPSLVQPGRGGEARETMGEHCGGGFWDLRSLRSYNLCDRFHPVSSQVPPHPPADLLEETGVHRIWPFQQCPRRRGYEG